MTDDGTDHEHHYGAFGRLVKITDRATPTPATFRTYRYNGLGHRIAAFEGTDQTGSGRGDYFIYDSNWRMVLRTLGDEDAGTSGEFTTEQVDINPADMDGFEYEGPAHREQWVYHNAGLAGLGGSGMLDSVVVRFADPGTSAFPMGTIAEQTRPLHNRRGDVVALVRSSDGIAKNDLAQRTTSPCLSIDTRADDDLDGGPKTPKSTIL